jgi:hypothetical protein
MAACAMVDACSCGHRVGGEQTPAEGRIMVSWRKMIVGKAIDAASSGKEGKLR